MAFSFTTVNTKQWIPNHSIFDIDQVAGDEWLSSSLRLLHHGTMETYFDHTVCIVYYNAFRPRNHYSRVISNVRRLTQLLSRPR